MELRGIANAPVSFGVWDPERALAAAQGEAEHYLSLLSGAGYEGTELGPPGYLGDRSSMGRRLAANGLRLVGGYLPLRFSESEALTVDLANLGAALDLLAAPGHEGTLAIFADDGGAALEASPGRPWDDRSLALDDPGWSRLADGVARAAAMARSRDLVPSFHPHIATHVESAWEIERLLALTDIDLTLDTGHLVLAGEPATRCLRAWSGRVNHVHVKDVRRRILREARAAGRTDLGTWWPRVPCRLGKGDADIAEFLETLASSDYEGWIVIEQDQEPTFAGAFESLAAEQAANLAFVRAALAGH